jgi:hypothetical protein
MEKERHDHITESLRIMYEASAREDAEASLHGAAEAEAKALECARILGEREAESRTLGLGVEFVARAPPAGIYGVDDPLFAKTAEPLSYDSVRGPGESTESIRARIAEGDCEELDIMRRTAQCRESRDPVWWAALYMCAETAAICARFHRLYEPAADLYILQTSTDHFVYSVGDPRVPGAVVYDGQECVWSEAGVGGPPVTRHLLKRAWDLEAFAAA